METDPWARGGDVRLGIVNEETPLGKKLQDDLGKLGGGEMTTAK